MLTLQNLQRSILVTATLLLVLSLSAASVAQDRNERQNKQIVAIELDEQEITLDGRLTESIWQDAVPASGFRQRMPNEGQPATQKTEVRFLYDDDALYVGARMFASNPDSMIVSMTRRDEAGNAERIIISLDTYRDLLTAYSFGVTAAGGKVDYYHAEDSEFDRDYQFDPVWEVRTTVDEQGWSAEFRIPFSQLRFVQNEKQVWGININRWMPDRNEDVYWVQIPSDETGWSSRFGVLVGLDDIESFQRGELLPYVAANLDDEQGIDARNPFRDRYNSNFRAGGDLKLGIGPNVTLEATINPDFGQIEADPAEVNLSAFETFFDERRPFFTEGARLLRGNGPSYYYSRRIGASPSREIEGEFVERPQNTTILGASKISGRFDSGLSIAALTAITDREFARSFDDSTGVRRRVEVEPRTLFAVTRLQQEFGASASSAGFSLTAVERDLEREPALDRMLAKRAIAGGGDWNLRFAGGAYEVNGYLGFSYVEGDELAIAGIQNRSSHFFQRPDASHVILDSTRTTLGGGSAGLALEKNSGDHWLWELTGWAESPEFEINDAGQLSSADDQGFQALVRYRENTPGRYYQNYNLRLYTVNEWNFGGVLQAHRNEFEGEFTFRNFWRIQIESGYFSRATSDNLTRGGPLMGTGRGVYGSVELTNGFASTTRWTVDFEGERNELETSAYGVEVELEMEPSERVSFSMTPEFQRRIDTRQFVAALDEGPAATFGRRYIFGRLDRRTLAVELRLSYAFNPELTLEFYAEPFAASGIFDQFGQLTAPRRRDLVSYGDGSYRITETEDGEYQVQGPGEQFGFSRSDFNVRSLQSNLVLRWEWRPGSTLYLVWQQDREDEAAPGEQIGAAALGEVFSGENNQFWGIKANYWFSL